MLGENLTYLQKVALKGDISLAFLSASHDTEIKFRAYLILKGVIPKLRPFFAECMKEALTFDAGVIDCLSLEIANNQVPVWLWIEEVMADIKLQLSLTENKYSDVLLHPLSLDKTVERQNLIESAFVFFAREAAGISTFATEQLLDKVLEDNDLEFLYNACFYLKGYCVEVRKEKKESEQVPEEIMTCLFNPRKTMDFLIETKFLKLLNASERREKKHKKAHRKQAESEKYVIQEDADLDEIPRKEAMKCISDTIAEIFGSPIKVMDSPRDVYVVKKVFPESGMSTDIRVCKTAKEAVAFIKKILKEYPELVGTCEFQICREEGTSDGEKGRRSKSS